MHGWDEWCGGRFLSSLVQKEEAAGRRANCASSVLEKRGNGKCPSTDSPHPFFPEAQPEGSTLVALQPGGCGGGAAEITFRSARFGVPQTAGRVIWHTKIAADATNPRKASKSQQKHIQKSPRTQKTQEKPAKASKSTYKKRRGRKNPRKAR